MNKGFTLVELLAVIIILGILTLITIVSVNPILKDAKKGLTDTQIDNIEEVASLYYIKYGVGLDDFELENPRDCINVSELIETGYIDKDEITNPTTGEEVLGSVKITYNANNYIYEYQDNVCTNYDKGIICERVEETEVGNVPEGKIIAGDAYNCKVDPNEDPYKFYVLTTPEEDSDMVNLIMDSNIRENGEAVKETTPTTEQIGTIPWITNSDYESEKTDDEPFDSLKKINVFGPITAMKFLQEATKSWTNIKSQKIKKFTECTQEGICSFKEMVNTYISRARLPYYSEVSNVSSSTLWLLDYLEDFNGYQENDVLDLHGYWTMSYNPAYDQYAWYVANGGAILGDEAIVTDGGLYGARPVISVYKFQME